MGQIWEFKTSNFVQHSMEQFIRENSKVAKKHIYPQLEQLSLEPWRRNADSCSSSSDGKIATPDDSSSDEDES